MEPIVSYMGKREHLIGNSLTFLDFIMLELCDFVQWLSEEEFYKENK